VLSEPAVRKKLEDLGLDLIVGTPAEFADTIRTETPQWAKLIKAAGIKAIE
jgi:tripartite-type tricarboxylate transporter receptor subunit TctC